MWALLQGERGAVCQWMNRQTTIGIVPLIFASVMSCFPVITAVLLLDQVAEWNPFHFVPLPFICSCPFVVRCMHLLWLCNGPVSFPICSDYVAHIELPDYCVFFFLCVFLQTSCLACSKDRVCGSSLHPLVHTCQKAFSPSWASSCTAQLPEMSSYADVISKQHHTLSHK